MLIFLFHLAIHHNFCVTRIEALLLQTRIALFTFNNAAATAAITRINTLLRSGSTLAIPVSSVLRGRCTFWYGMFFHNIKDYDSALECFVLASDLLSTVKQPETGTPCTPHGPLPEGAYEAERVLKMKLKAELEISRTPATTTTTTSTVLATPAKDRQPSLDILRQESVVPLSARLWRQTSHSSWADELSSLCDEGSSSSSSSDGKTGTTSAMTNAATHRRACCILFMKDTSLSLSCLDASALTWPFATSVRDRQPQ